MQDIRQSVGKKGEELAQKYLKENGYSIIETNYRCHFGEADIIAMKDKEIAFIEVKTRGQEIYGNPAESINYIKRKHIYKVAEFYAYKNKIMDAQISLDAIEVYVLDNKKTKIEHIKNAIWEYPKG